MDFPSAAGWKPISAQPLCVQDTGRILQIRVGETGKSFKGWGESIFGRAVNAASRRRGKLKLAPPWYNKWHKLQRLKFF